MVNIQKIKNDKVLLRKNTLKIRDSIAPPYIMEASELICKYVYLESRYIRCKDVLIYSSFGSEVNTRPLIDKAFKDGKCVYFPKVEGDIMNFYRVGSLEELNSGYKGIMEPFGIGGEFQRDSEAICVIPGVCFGKNGYRIGYGKGYYDRFLARYPGLYKIGLSFEKQMVDYVPYEETDIRLDEIICENYILTRDGKGDARWI